MNNLVEAILRKDGPCLSSSLVSKLMSEYGLKYDAARKQVSRGCIGLKKLGYLVFPKRVRFIYLEKDFGSSYYWSALEEALKNSNSSYGLAYFAIEERNGVIPESHFNSICGSPLKQKKHISADTIKDNMLKANIIKIRHVNRMGNCLILGKLSRDESDTSFEYYAELSYARIMAEDIAIIPSIKKWLQNNGLVSYDKVNSRDNNKFPSVFTFEFDMTAPSYLGVLSEYDKSKELIKPGFVTCDILYNKITENSIEPFIKKYKSLASLKSDNNIKVLHILIAQKYSSDALHKAKSSRLLLPVTLDSLFGKKVSIGVDSLVNIYRDIRRDSLNLGDFDVVFDAFEGMKGIYGNIRGTLFELVCTDIIRKNIRPDSIETNKKIRINEDSAEIDIMIEIKNKSLCFIECKGYQPDSVISHEEIKKWLTVRVPRIRKWVLSDQRWKNMSVSFELWITCEINDDSKAIINRQKEKIRKYNLNIRNREDILGYVNNTKDTELINIYKKYFNTNPLEKTDKSINDIKRKVDDI